MMRKAAKAKRRFSVPSNKLDEYYDIAVDAKSSAVMVFANSRGRPVVEDLAPDVKWSTDPIFASVHSSDWLFTHVRVIKLQPPFSDSSTPETARPDALGFAVAHALQSLAPQNIRVGHFSGHGADMQLNFFDIGPNARQYERLLVVEYVSPTTDVTGAA